MIDYSNGRYRSVRTKTEAEFSLSSVLAKLAPEEHEALKVILADLEKQQKGNNLLEDLNRLELKSEPVDLKTFIYDPYYLGNTCDVLYPTLFADLKELFDGDYNEAVLTGSIGWGKTFMASIGICYFIYQLSLMKNPQRSFGIAATSYIDIVAFSVTEELAKKVAFDNIVGKIEASEYFQTHFPFDVTKREIRFPNNVRVAPRATTDNSALGLNVVAGLLDETDFMTAKRVKGSNTRMVLQDRAENIYNNIKRRMKSRFQKQGKLPGILFVVSSKNAKDSFSERLIKRSMKGSDLFVRDYATWDVKPPEDLSSADRFWVLVGNDQIPSKIVKPEELQELQEKLPDDCVLIDVPEDYRVDFERDLEGSIRDTAGIATVSVSPFIQRREKIMECIGLYERTYPGMSHPFTVEEFEPGKGGAFMWEKMVQMTRERGFLGHWEEKWRPKINPRAIRHVHIDPSLSGDATGICVAHVSDYKDVIRKAADGQEYTERAAVYTVDFMLRIKPPIGDEIILGDVRQFIYDLSAHGYIISTVTLDGWQSADSLQTLAKKGYNSELLSVDRTMDPYENMKMALYESRVLMYQYVPLLRELRTIQKDLVRKKVDHPIGGSKDVSDALAGCLFTLSQNSASQPLPIIRVDHNMNDEAWVPQTDLTVRGGSANQMPMWQDIVPPFMIGNSAKDWNNGED